VDWYNHEHRHSRIMFVTPAQRHDGEDKGILEKRTTVYELARSRMPERWSGKTRNWSLVGAVALNLEKHRFARFPSSIEHRVRQSCLISAKAGQFTLIFDIRMIFRHIRMLFFLRLCSPVISMSTQDSGNDLLTDMRDLMRRFHYFIHTERTYCDWVVRFHSMEMRETFGGCEDKRWKIFLTRLAVHDNVAVSTQNQAFNALVFLYKRVLQQPLDNVSVARSRREGRIPAAHRLKKSHSMDV